jgi:hypothetical protein
VAELEEATSTAQARVRRANLLVELARSEHGIASDAVDLVADKLDVEFNDDDEPQDVKEAVEQFLERHPSVKRRSEGGGGSPGSPGAGRRRGGHLTTAEARRIAKEDPERFNEMIDKGEVSPTILSRGE